MRYHLTAARKASIKKKEQVLASTRRKGTPSAQLVGIEIHSATMEKSMEVPQKIENRNTI